MFYIFVNDLMNEFIQGKLIKLPGDTKLGGKVNICNVRIKIGTDLMSQN